MVSRFEPQDIERGGGLVSEDHVIIQANGRKVTISSDEASNTPKPRGDLELEDAKRRILNRLPQQEAKLRGISRVAIAEARKVYKRADASARLSGGDLRVVEKSKFMGELTEISRQAVRSMRESTFSNIERSTKTYLLALRRSLKGREDINMTQIQEVASRVARQVYNAPSGKDGVTTPQRLASLGSKIEDRLISNLSKESRDTSSMYLGLVDSKGSHRSCVSRNLARINRTEQSRAIHQATLDVSASLGIGLFYWRLSAAHKGYGGSEVCEVLSNATGADVSTALPNGFTGSSRGLYTASTVPQLPHPNCMCSIEPLLI